MPNEHASPACECWRDLAELSELSWDFTSEIEASIGR